MQEKNQSPIPEIKVTDDGSHTLYLHGMDEHYHSHYGALTESMHIFITLGLRFCNKETIRILEVGFGTGLNALMTALDSETTGRNVYYYSLEKYPLSSGIIKKLNYGSLNGPIGEKIYEKIHSAPWGKTTAITESFTLVKQEMDLTKDTIPGKYDLIFYDAFGPDKQPEMWSSEVFTKISEASETGTIFVTYSAKGSLQRMLRSFDFEVTLLPGPPGKRCITRAVKK
jgi:tRNA U34 5-methylaminomethyl-2-thiouridine-forming methyltransferase MnmC